MAYFGLVESNPSCLRPVLQEVCDYMLQQALDESLFILTTAIDFWYYAPLNFPPDVMQPYIMKLIPILIKNMMLPAQEIRLQSLALNYVTENLDVYQAKLHILPTDLVEMICQKKKEMKENKLGKFYTFMFPIIVGAKEEIRKNATAVFRCISSRPFGDMLQIVRSAFANCFDKSANCTWQEREACSLVLGSIGGNLHSTPDDQVVNSQKYLLSVAQSDVCN
jgi:hypothetical protein